MNRRDFINKLINLPLAFALTDLFFSSAEGKSQSSKSNYICLQKDLKTQQLDLRQNGFLNEETKALPASLMKLITFICLLENKLISTQKEFECKGIIKIGGKVYKCQKPHGKLNLEKALAHSCNIFFSQAAQEISLKQFLIYTKLFSFDFKISNHISPIADYALGLSPEMSINLLSALNLAVSIAQKNAKSISNSTYLQLHKAMNLSSIIGTAKLLDNFIACKTGTVLLPNKQIQSFQSWIIGFYPYETPIKAFALLTTDGTSKEAAIPLAKKLLNL